MGTSNPGRMDEREMTRNAKSAAADAQATADAAQSAASAVTTLAEGLITRSPLPPSGDGVADGALWLEYGAEGVITHQWDADSESWEIPSADPVMLASAIIGHLAAGVIDTTEVTVKSGDSGARMQMLGNLLRFFDSTGTLTAEIGGNDGRASLGNASVVGDIWSGGGVGIPGTSMGLVEFRSAPIVGALYARILADSASLLIHSLAGDLGLRAEGRVNIGGPAGVEIDGESSGVNINHPILGGTLDISAITNKDAIRNSLGLGNTTGPVPVANGGTGNATGQAPSATVLATSRTIQTNLASTSAASFNGSANATPGVTGTLPIANGGTGATTAAGIRAAIGAAVQEADFSGTITLTSAAGGLSGVFTLPSGMTQSNTLIHVSKQGGGLAKYIPYVNWVSSTTFQIGLYSGDGTSASGNVAVAAYARRIS
ncbi:hypothetical protein GCM10010401_07480 [Rarobacter faecitabidus]|uniref:Uncharacterized protein n=1 Tax=Rarobacter faecitabidus TaxID=13243 RepID=A0A542ZAJ1_RARFA|nr:hypothetical protein [Rarobacter faecitabidus]TQL57357.1 hypothetical protein FB461_2089 [Rarobacter faecitabidus]